MVSPSLFELRKHRARIQGCNTYEAFKTAQLEFLDLLVALLVKEEKELQQAARDILAVGSETEMTYTPETG